MKILRITVQGLPLFKQELDLVFYTQQRVGEDDKDKLFFLKPNYFLHQAVAFIGINASGKTSVLKAINMALDIINNQPINHSEAKTILGSSQKIAYKIYFFDIRNILELWKINVKPFNPFFIKSFPILINSFNEYSVVSVFS